METKSGTGTQSIPKPGDPNYVRLRDQGPLYLCTKCGQSRRSTYNYTNTCYRSIKDSSGVYIANCGGNLVQDYFRDAIEQAREKLEITKLKLQKVEKNLRDMDQPTFQFRGDKEQSIDHVTKKRDKIRRQLTTMGYDWTKLDD